MGKMGEMGSFFKPKILTIKPDFTKTAIDVNGFSAYFQRTASEENIHVLDEYNNFKERPKLGVIYPKLRHVMMGVTYHDFCNACILPIPEGVRGDRLRDIAIFCIPQNNILRLPTQLRLVQP